ncbi:MAG: hypothetical protein ACI4TS_03585 [Bacteroidaceae bacterium]
MKTVCLKIADFNVRVTATDDNWLLPSNYNPFRVDETRKDDSLMEIFVDDRYREENSVKLLGSFDELGFKQEVFSCDEGDYMFRIFDMSGRIATQMFSNSDFTHNEICMANLDEATMSFGFNNAMMIAFAFSSAYHATLTMHSSVVEKDGWGYMFLGKSGTGKSTHSSLWLKYIDDTQLLNDDNPILRVVDDKVFVYGSPWSGKTPCYKQRKAEVGALVMLEQKPYNNIERQNVISALSSLMCSCSIMIWDKSSYDSIMNTMSEVITLASLYHLSCLPDKEAAELSYNTIRKVE